MGKKKKSGGKRGRQSVSALAKASARSTSWVGRGFALGALVLIAGLGWLVLAQTSGQNLELPEIDLESMEPQVREAILEFQATALDEPTSENVGSLGELLQAHGLDAEASVCYRQASALQDDFRWRYLNAHALRARQPEAALEQARLAVELNPAYSAAHVVIGQLLEQDGRVEEAHQAFTAAVDADPESATAVFGYGRTLLSLGRLEPALKQLTRAAELAPQAGEVRAALAQVYRQLGDREEATRQARLAAEQRETIGITDPVHFRMRQRSRSSITMLQRAIQARSEGRFEDAESLLRELVVLRPADANIHTELGDTLSMTEHLGEARESYETALELNPDAAGALYGLGNALNLEGDYDRAETHYRRSLEQRPDHVPTLLNLGGVLVFRKRLEEAEAVFREALEVEPDGFGPNRQLGQVLLKQRRIDEAIRHLEQALQAEPDSGPVHLQLALAYAAAGEMLKTREHARRAQDAGQSLPDPLRRLVANIP